MTDLLIPCGLTGFFFQPCIKVLGVLHEFGHGLILNDVS